MSLKEGVEEKSFMNQIEKLKEQYPRIIDIKDAIIWTLARDPEYGESLPSNKEFKVYKTESLNTEDVNFWVLYKHKKQGEKVHLYSIAPIL